VKLQSIGLLFMAHSMLATAATSWDVTGKSLRADVFVGDLNLSSTGGARTALERIRRTAIRLCNRERHSSRIDDREVTAECIREAQTAALAHLHDAMVRQGAATHPGV
jgi:UrcA family protein